MATVQKRETDKGTSYKLIAYLGYDTQGKQIRKMKTWKPPATMSPAKAAKEAQKAADRYEEGLTKGLIAFDGKITFAEYTAKWLENADITYNTREGYTHYLNRILPAIGHMQLEKIQAHHIQSFNKSLATDGTKKQGRSATAKKHLGEYIEKQSLTGAELSRRSGLSESTISATIRGKKISPTTAEKLATALGEQVPTLFDADLATTGLSDKTILHHHRLITLILEQAKRERIIPFNVASEHMKAPKVSKKEATYLEEDEVRHIVNLLLPEKDIRLKTFILLFLASGVRRGELCGLSWSDIDEKNRLIHIRRGSQYQKGKGTVEVGTKNTSSIRPIQLPQESFELLREYRNWWDEQKAINGDHWQGKNERLFIQSNGKPVNPDTINYWLGKFIKQHKLPHFTPHSLRHTYATLQIAHGVDIRTLQARTGHSQASTLTDVYTHALKSKTEAAADILGNILNPNSIVDSQPTLRQEIQTLIENTPNSKLESVKSFLISLADEKITL